jgi:ribosomal protein S18 acetylase RimI-like enzyme
LTTERDSLRGTEFRVRLVRPPEFDEAGRVTALAYREFVRPGDRAWTAYLERVADVAGRAQRALVLVAVDGDDRILGSTTLELDARIDDDDAPLGTGEAHVRMLGVGPESRGRGVARALMEACANEARARGKTRLTLHTTERMIVAQRMYESMGFVRGTDRTFPDGFSLLTYAKEL